MGSLTPLWRHLEDYPGVPHTMDGWRRVCGRAVDAILPLLRRTGELAPSYPSPDPNAVDLTVIHHSNGRLVAVGEEDPTVRIELDPDAVALYELDLGRLWPTVAEALGLQASAPHKPVMAGLTLVGEWKPRPATRIPAWHACHADPSGRVVLVRSMAATAGGPAILFTYTGSWWPPEFEGWVKERKVVLVPLSEVLDDGMVPTHGWGAYLDVARGLIRMRPLADAGPTCQYRIAREGDFWEVVFAGRKSPPLKSKGFAYLQLMVRFPYQTFGYEELLLLDLPSDVDVDPGTAGIRIDREAAADYYRQMRDLREEEEEARLSNNIAGAEAARLKRGVLSKEIRNAVHRGVFRTQAKEVKNLRLRINAALKRAVAELKKHDSTAAAHLSQMTTKGGPVYRPKTTVPWGI